MEFDDFVTSVAPYMGRLLAILKYAAVTLQIFSTEEGENLKKALDEVQLNFLFQVIDLATVI